MCAHVRTFAFIEEGRFYTAQTIMSGIILINKEFMSLKIDYKSFPLTSGKRPDKMMHEIWDRFFHEFSSKQDHRTDPVHRLA